MIHVFLSSCRTYLGVREVVVQCELQLPQLLLLFLLFLTGLLHLAFLQDIEHRCIKVSIVGI